MTLNKALLALAVLAPAALAQQAAYGQCELLQFQNHSSNG
jgi:hypothetical protein